jgi:pimeloyl-ACP methyl ester carboxylesterase
MFPTDVSLLAIDMMGHGRSSHYPKGQFYYLYWDGVSLIRRICRHFNWHTITLLGHSLGGAIAFLYAASYPEMVNKLICIDIASPVLRKDEKFVHECGYIMEKFLDYEDILDKNLPCYKYEDVVELLMKAYKDSLTRESCEILLQRGLKKASDGSGYHFSRDVRLKIAGLGNISRSTVLEFASFVSCEVLNIKGKPGNIFDEEEFYYEVVEKMKSSVAKRVEFYEVEGMHHLHLNNPERVMPYISSFLMSECDESEEK